MPPLGKLVAAQSWKLWLCAAVLLLTGIAYLWNRTIGQVVGVSPAVVSLLATLVALITFGFAALSVVCPSCGLHLVWFAVSQKPVGRWLSWLLGVESCPRCHYRVPGQGGVVA
jgi:hypothetical protein